MLRHLKNKELIKQLYKKPPQEKTYPHIQILAPNILQEIDVLYLQEDPKGFKYLLTIIDVHNSLCGAYALKTLTMKEIIPKLQEIYDNSMYLSYPRCLQGDSEFNTREMKKWCKDRDINLKITEPGESRQNAHIERLNQTLGELLWVIEVDAEIESGKPNTEWHKYYKDLINELNERRAKQLDKNYQRPEREMKDEPIIDKNNNYIIENGTKVRMKLEYPETIHGEKLNGVFRKTDHRWRYTPTYEVVESYLMPNNPILYKIKNTKTGKILREKYTAQRLQII